jgi:hypothetical protein
VAIEVGFPALGSFGEFGGLEPLTFPACDSVQQFTLLDAAETPNEVRSILGATAKNQYTFGCIKLP